MKGFVAGMSLVLMTALATVLACAAEAPVVVSHRMTGYEPGSSVATVEFTVHVENPGTKPLANLSLAVNPPASMRGRTTLELGSLGPNEGSDVILKLQAPAALPREQIARLPLFLGGKCLDATGTLVEFPVQSYPGGAP